MTNAALPAVARGPRGGFHGPVIAVIDQPESAGRFTPATITDPPQRRDGLRELQARREALAERLASLQRQSRSREASTCSAELRAVTTRLMELGRE